MAVGGTAAVAEAVFTVAEAEVFTVVAEVVFTAVVEGVGPALMAADVLWGVQAERRRVRLQGRALMGIAASASDRSA